MSILDGSIAEKYSYLPAPLGDSSAAPEYDPFEVRISLPSMTSSIPLVPTAMATSSSILTPTKSQGQGQSNVAASNQMSWSMSSATNQTFSSPSGTQSGSSGSGIFSTPGGSSSGMSTSLFSPNEVIISSPSSVRSASPASATTSPPPLPPRIYANLPDNINTEETVVKKPLPPLPGNPTPRSPKLGSHKSNSMSVQQTIAAVSSESAHSRQDSNSSMTASGFQRTPSFKCYDCHPEPEDNLNNKHSNNYRSNLQGIDGPYAACAHNSPVHRSEITAKVEDKSNISTIALPPATSSVTNFNNIIFPPPPSSATARIPSSAAAAKMPPSAPSAAAVVPPASSVPAMIPTPLATIGAPTAQAIPVRPASTSTVLEARSMQGGASGYSRHAQYGKMDPNSPSDFNKNRAALKPKHLQNTSGQSASLPVGMHPYYGNMAQLPADQRVQPTRAQEHEPFDWLTGAVKDFTFDKNQGSGNNFNTPSEKSALNTWDNKNILGQPSPKHEIYQNCDFGGARAKVTSPTSPGSDLYGQVNKTYRSVDGDDVGWASDEWDSSDEENTSAPPPLPPKDFPGAGLNNRSHGGPKVPRILPVMKDGEKVSQYYYFVVPERDRERPPVCSPITAEVKPFAVGGVQVDRSRRKPEELYQNLNFHQNAAMNSGMGQGASLGQSYQGRGNSANAVTTDAGSLSWAGLTGLRAVGSSVDPPIGATALYQNTSNMNTATASITSSSQNSVASMTAVREKILEIQRQVHGITEEEAHAALSSHQWNMDAASKYLKVEQLLRLGIASRERCQKLLEKFKWNLEMAGSVLLDELSMGSAV